MKRYCGIEACSVQQHKLTIHISILSTLSHFQQYNNTSTKPDNYKNCTFQEQAARLWIAPQAPSSVSGLDEDLINAK